MNDTTRKWLKRLADSIGVNTDELVEHLDSIRDDLPKNLIDSIRKFNGEGLDSLDALIKGVGKGFRGVDSLIDSALFWLSKGNEPLDSSFNAVTDSLGAINATGSAIAGRLDTMWNGTLITPDTGNYGTLGDSWFSHGDALADSIKNGIGFASIDFAGDSSRVDSLVLKGYTCVGDSCCLDGNQFCIHWDSDTLIVDSLARYQMALYDSLIAYNQTYREDSVPELLQEIYDSVKSINPFGIFDSTIMSELGASIPNTNTCPENCTKWEVDIPFFYGTQHFTIDFGLCLGRAVFANGNVLSFLRFLIRLIVAWTCISMVMWNAAEGRRK